MKDCSIAPQLCEEYARNVRIIQVTKLACGLPVSRYVKSEC